MPQSDANLAMRAILTLYYKGKFCPKCNGRLRGYKIWECKVCKTDLFPDYIPDEFKQLWNELSTTNKLNIVKLRREWTMKLNKK